jgi:hypothetical protein
MRQSKTRNIHTARLLIPALTTMVEPNDAFTVNEVYGELTKYFPTIAALITGETEHARKCSLGLIFSYCIDLDINGHILKQSTGKGYPKKYFITNKYSYLELA